MQILIITNLLSIRCACIAAVFSLLTFFHTVHAQSKAAEEYQLKAVFIYNFTHFIEWSPSSFETSDSPVIIGVLGKNVFGNYLDQAIAGEQINGRAIKVYYYATLDDLKKCHILFISNSEKGRVSEILSSKKIKDILTISDLKDFTLQGGMIRFFHEDHKIRLEINLDAITTGNIKVSSKLLRVSKVIGEDDGRR